MGPLHVAKNGCPNDPYASLTRDRGLFGNAPAWGAGGRWFESSLPDQISCLTHYEATRPPERVALFFANWVEKAISGLLHCRSCGSASRYSSPRHFELMRQVGTMEKRRSITRGNTEGKSQRTSRFPYMETRHVDVWSVHQRVLMLGGSPLNLTSSTRTESSNDLERLQTARFWPLHA